MKNDNVLRDRIDESLKFLLRLLAILDVNHGGDPRRFTRHSAPCCLPILTYGQTRLSNGEALRVTENTAPQIHDGLIVS
jgi:hypothetical protein